MKSRLPGGGPWKIEPLCPALLHNTVSSAKNGPHDKRCICPHARDLLAAQREIERVRKAARAPAGNRRTAGAGSPKGAGSQPAYLRNVRYRMPDLTGGLCQTFVGQSLANQLFSPRSNERAIATAAHKRLCGRCPLLADCAAGVLRCEAPGGSWGGVYGAMSSAERKKIWDEGMSQQQKEKQ